MNCHSNPTMDEGNNRNKTTEKALGGRNVTTKRVRLEGDEFPEHEQRLKEILDEAETRFCIDKTRYHLGASDIGHPCPRYLYNTFRWADKPNHSARTRRIFRRGRMDERNINDCLSAIASERTDCSIQTHNEDGQQFHYSLYSGHIACSLDAIVTIDQTPYVLEIKTHNNDSFEHLKQHGVRHAKPNHYDQIQLCLECSGFNVGMLLAINKNNDAIFTESVPYNEEHCNRLVERAKRAIFDNVPPPKIANNAGAAFCQRCEFKTICHTNRPPQKSCRTCHHGGAQTDGSFHCHRHNTPIDRAKQTVGCNDYKPFDPTAS